MWHQRPVLQSVKNRPNFQDTHDRAPPGIVNTPLSNQLLTDLLRLTGTSHSSSYKFSITVKLILVKSNIFQFVLTICLALAAYTLQAQNSNSDNSSTSKFDTIKIHVDGVCGMCKSRIELAVYDLKGVKTTDWDIESGQLVTVVKKGKASKEDIGDALANIGHSSEVREADPEAYAKLPGCCKYDDGVPKHGIDEH